VNVDVEVTVDIGEDKGTLVGVGLKLV